MGRQHSLIMAVNESLTPSLELKYNSDILHNLMCPLMPIVQVNIIISYLPTRFFTTIEGQNGLTKCFGCKKYFEKEDIVQCVCDNWCKICARVQVSLGFCTFCNNGCLTYAKELDQLTCIFIGCTNKANYGNTDEAVFCGKHISDHLVIDHHNRCEKIQCSRSAIYCDAGGFLLCRDHASNDSILLITEGKNYKNTLLEKKCIACQKFTSAVYLCPCCTQYRCKNCAYLEMFSLANNDAYVGVYCCNCVKNYNIVDEKTQGYSYGIFNECEDCCDEAKWYNFDDMKFYCNIHRKDNCVNSKYKCNFKKCFAVTLINSEYCRVHTKLLVEKTKKKNKRRERKKVLNRSSSTN